MMRGYLDALLQARQRRVSAAGSLVAKRREVVSSSCVSFYIGGGTHARRHEKRDSLASEKSSERSFLYLWRSRSSQDGTRALCRTQGAKGIRGKSATLLRLTIVSQLVFLLCVPSYAFAVGGWNSIIYGPTSIKWDGTTYTEVGIAASNKFDAALIALDKFYVKVQLTHDMFAKLSNPQTGGAFYEFAQLFYNPSPSGFDLGYVESDQIGTVAIGFWDTAYGVYGAGNVWSAEYTNRQKSSALEDLGVILNGGDLGGEVGDLITFQGNTRIQKTSSATTASSSGVAWYSSYDKGSVSNVKYVSYYVTADGADNSKLIVDAPSFSLPLPEGFTDAHPVSQYDYFLLLRTASDRYDNRFLSTYVYACKKNHYELTSSTNSITEDGYTNTKSYYSNLTADAGEYDYISYDASDWQHVKYTGTNGGYVLDYDPDLHWDTHGNSSALSASSVAMAIYPMIGYAEPTLPENNWPVDETPNPDPPEVPEPTSPVVEPPDIPGVTEDPLPPIPTGGNQTEPTGTTPADYTPWFRAILLQLNKITDILRDRFGGIYRQFATHCNHIRQTIADYAVYLAGCIDHDFGELQSYLRDLAVWLSEQLSFDVSSGGYDDSTVVSWLKKIYWQLYLMGSSGKVEPLEGVNYDTALSRVGASYGELSDNLPFCVPDDMQTVLRLVAADPITPVFDVPWGFVGGQGRVHVDLTAWNGVAAGCRLMFYALFCLELTKYTLHLWRLYRAAFVGVSV